MSYVEKKEKSLFLEEIMACEQAMQQQDEDRTEGLRGDGEMLCLL